MVASGAEGGNTIPMGATSGDTKGTKALCFGAAKKNGKYPRNYYLAEPCRSRGRRMSIGVEAAPEDDTLVAVGPPPTTLSSVTAFVPVPPIQPLLHTHHSTAPHSFL